MDEKTKAIILDAGYIMNSYSSSSFTKHQKHSFNGYASEISFRDGPNFIEIQMMGMREFIWYRVMAHGIPVENLTKEKILDIETNLWEMLKPVLKS